MKRVKLNELKLDELAEASGVPPRTIRLYIARGLLPGPLRSGRGAVYGAEHLAALQRTKDLQRQGLTLAEIRLRQAGEAGEIAVPPPTNWWSYAVAPDVTVQMRGDLAGWRLRQIRKALSNFAKELGTQPEKEESDVDNVG